jgi:hypothetical protein
MLIINPTPFQSLRSGREYIINPQAPKRVTGHLGLWGQCTLSPVSIVANSKIPGNSYAEFVCKDKGHRYRFCALRPSLKIPQAKFIDARQSVCGNIIVQMHCAQCHSCGEISTQCWQEYTGHYVCYGCVLAKKTSAPYAYGNVDASCCRKGYCGEALYFYSEPTEKVFERALEICERYKVIG